MTSVIQLQSNDWLVFIEGVQVPFVGFTYTVGTNMVASGSVRVAPDSLIANIRPHAVVSIFFKDRYPDKEEALPVEDRYVYFGGGEITSITVDKQPHTKGVQLSFTHEEGILEQHAAFATGIGGTFTSLVASGSTLVNPFSQQSSNDLFSIKMLNIFPDAKNAPASAYDYVNNVLGAIAWFSAHNASLRNRVVQHRLLHKFGGVNTLILKELITRQVGSGLAAKVQDMVGGGDTPLSILDKLNSVPDYKRVSVAAPHYKETPKIKIFPLNDEKDERLSRRFFVRDWNRYDSLYLPNMHYAAPPPCNFIFPDMVESISYTRTFRSEATRTTYEDNITKSPSATQRVTFVSSDDIPGIKNVKNPIQFWAAAQETLGTNKDLAPITDVGPLNYFDYPDSPYSNKRIDKDKNVTEYNLLDSIADTELAKGVVTQRIQPDSEYVAALVKIGSVISNGTQLQQALTQESKNKDANDYTKYVQQWVDYKHGLAKFNRQANLIIKGHRWIVPGFTAVIFDQDVSFVCLVDGVTHMYDTSGNERTNVTISSARPITSIPDNVFNTAIKLSNNIDDLKEELRNTIFSEFSKNDEIIDTLLQAVKDNASKIAESSELSESIINASIDATVSGEQQPQPALGTSADLIRFMNSVTELVKVGNDVAAKVVGPQREVAGSITAQRFPELAKEWLTYLNTPISSVSYSGVYDLVTKLTEYCEKLASNIKQVLFNQQQQAVNNEPWFSTDSAVTNAVARELLASGVKLSESEAALRKIIRDLENNNNVPSPPSFYPLDLTDLNLLDQKYQALLGCKPFYSKLVPSFMSNIRNLFKNDSPDSDVKDPATGGFVKKGGTPAQYLGSHQSMIKAFSKIFSGVSAAGISDSIKLKANSEFKTWDSIIASDGENSLEWQHRTFLKRGHQTLRDYLRTHGFSDQLKTYISSEPTPTYFYVMTPTIPQISSFVYTDTETKTPYQFDNSCLCRLVDEMAIYGGSGIYDPLVAKRRNEVRDPTVTAQFRQEQIIHYSRKHMGARAYRGD